MKLLEIVQGFIDLFRSRYVRYLEKEVIRLRQETAGLNHTLLGLKGIQQTPTPDLQDLSARGQKLRNQVASEKSGPSKIVRRGTHAGLRRELEFQSQVEAAEIEKEISNRRDARKEQEKANAAQ